MQTTQVSSTVAGSKAGRFLRLALLGLLGTGVAGNGVATYINDQNHAREIKQLTEGLGQKQSAIEELSTKLQQEEASNQSQEEKLGAQYTNMISFFEKLEKEQLKTSDLNAQVDRLNKELGSRITLDQIKTAVNMVKASTVIVEVEDEMRNPFTGEKRITTGGGSGVILIGEHGERYVLTCNHVTENGEIKSEGLKDPAYRIKVYNGSDYEKPVTFNAPPVILANGQRAYSKFGEHDVSLLQIPPDVKLPANIGVPIRDIAKHKLEEGEPIITIGGPFGQKDSVSFGTISHVDRKIEWGPSKNHHIQIDSAAAPGSSGGPIFSIRVEDGKLVVELIGLVNGGYGIGVGDGIRIDDIQKTINDLGIKLK